MCGYYQVKKRQAMLRMAQPRGANTMKNTKIDHIKDEYIKLSTQDRSTYTRSQYEQLQDTCIELIAYLDERDSKYNLLHAGLVGVVERAIKIDTHKRSLENKLTWADSELLSCLEGIINGLEYQRRLVWTRMQSAERAYADTIQGDLYARRKEFSNN
jgi:hypothetical protein